MSAPRIAITTSSFAGPSAPHRQRLASAGLEVVDNPYGRKLTEAESKEHLHDVVGVLAGTSPLNAAVLEAAPRLRVISRIGVGIDNVDLDAQRQRGIALYTTPDAPAQAVAELTMGLMLDGLRRIAEADRVLREGRWKPLRGRLLQGKTVGIVGMGRVGHKLARFLEPFEGRILGVDPVTPDEAFLKRYRVEMTDLNTLCRESDIVTLHIPHTEATHHLMGARHLQAMKPNALLINAARGGVVDEDALLDTLASGHLAGAALDTFADEPYDGPLTSMSNVVLTCHMGSAAEESRTQMEEEAVENLLTGLRDAGVV